MNDGAIQVVAHLVPREGRGAELASAVVGLVAAVRSEPGCLAYQAYESLEAPGTIVVIETWASQAALDSHAQAAALTEFAADAGPFLAGAPAVERMTRLG
jgi:quinol monooxygenase YgiN